MKEKSLRILKGQVGPGGAINQSTYPIPILSHSVDSPCSHPEVVFIVFPGACMSPTYLVPKLEY